MEEAEIVDDNNRIVVKRITRRSKAGTREESMHFFGTGPGTGNRWLSYLLFAPVLIVMGIIGIFFFTAFLALFAIAAAGLGFRLWWLRRKLRQAAEGAEAPGSVETGGGDYTIIEDAEIIEETTNRPPDFNREKGPGKK